MHQCQEARDGFIAHPPHARTSDPGLERVEGYTSFLWVVLLAGVDRILGVAPEQAANPLLLASTVALWALLAREALRARGPGEPWWPSLVPLTLLAATRSVAVWSTSASRRAFSSS